MTDLSNSDCDLSSESDDCLSGPEESPKVMKCKVTVLMVILFLFGLLIVSLISCGTKKHEGFHMCNYAITIGNIVEHFQL